MANDSYRTLIAVERKSRNLTSDSLWNDNDNIREKKSQHYRRKEYISYFWQYRHT